MKREEFVEFLNKSPKIFNSEDEMIKHFSNRFPDFDKYPKVYERLREQYGFVKPPEKPGFFGKWGQGIADSVSKVGQEIAAIPGDYAKTVKNAGVRTYETMKDISTWDKDEGVLGAAWDAVSAPSRAVLSGLDMAESLASPIARPVENVARTAAGVLLNGEVVDNWKRMHKLNIDERPTTGNEFADIAADVASGLVPLKKLGAIPKIIKAIGKPERISKLDSVNAIRKANRMSNIDALLREDPLPTIKTQSVQQAEEFTKLDPEIFDKAKTVRWELQALQKDMSDLHDFETFKKTQLDLKDVQPLEDLHTFRQWQKTEEATKPQWKKAIKQGKNLEMHLTSKYGKDVVDNYLDLLHNRPELLEVGSLEVAAQLEKVQRMADQLPRIPLEDLKEAKANVLDLEQELKVKQGALDAKKGQVWYYQDTPYNINQKLRLKIARVKDLQEKVLERSNPRERAGLKAAANTMAKHEVTRLLREANPEMDIPDEFGLIFANEASNITPSKLKRAVELKQQAINSLKNNIKSSDVARQNLEQQKHLDMFGTGGTLESVITGSKRPTAEVFGELVQEEVVKRASQTRKLFPWLPDELSIMPEEAAAINRLVRSSNLFLDSNMPIGSEMLKAGMRKVNNGIITNYENLAPVQQKNLLEQILDTAEENGWGKLVDELGKQYNVPQIPLQINAIQDVNEWRSFLLGNPESEILAPSRLPEKTISPNFEAKIMEQVNEMIQKHPSFAASPEEFINKLFRGQTSVHTREQGIEFEKLYRKWKDAGKLSDIEYEGVIYRHNLGDIDTSAAGSGDKGPLRRLTKHLWPEQKWTYGLDKVRRGYMNKVRTVLKRSGGIWKEYAEKMDLADEYGLRRTGKLINHMDKTAREIGVTKADIDFIYKYRNGWEGKLTSKQSQYNDYLENLFDHFILEAQTIGIRNAKTGEIIQKVGNYAPKKLKPEWRQKLNTQAGVDEINKEYGLELSLKDAKDAWFRFGKNRNANLEYGRADIKLPEEAYQTENGSEIIENYIHMANMRLERAHMFGPDDEWVKGVTNAAKSTDLEKFVQEVSKQYLEHNSSEIAEEVLNWARGWQTVTRLTLAQTMNMSQSFLTALQTSNKSVAKAVWKSFTDEEARDFAEISGAVSQTYAMHLRSTMGGDASAYVGKTLNVTGFSATEKHNRIIAAIAGREEARSLANQLAKTALDSDSWKLTARRLDQMGIDAKRLADQNFVLTAAQEATAGYKTSQVTQFANSINDLPVGWHNPFVKTAFQFKQFGLNASALIKQHMYDDVMWAVKTKNTAYLKRFVLNTIPAMTLAGGGGFILDTARNNVRNAGNEALVEAFGENIIKDIDANKPDEKTLAIAEALGFEGIQRDVFAGWLDGLAQMGGLTIAWDLTQAASFGESGLTNYFMGPSFGGAFQTISRTLGASHTLLFERSRKKRKKATQNLVSTLGSALTPFGQFVSGPEEE